MDIYLKHKSEVDQINADYCKGKSLYRARIYEWHDLTTEEFFKSTLRSE